MIFKPGDPRNPTKRNMAARKANSKTAATGITPAGKPQKAIASTATVQEQIAQPEGSQPQPKAKQHHVGKSRRELTARAKTVVRSLLEGANTTQALINAGYSKGYAIHHKESILANPTIQRTFSQVLEAAGVTDDKIADKIRSLIDAKETKYFSHQGEVTDSREVEALGIQADMVQFAAKLKGHVIDRSTNLNVNMDISPVDLDRWGKEAPDMVGSRQNLPVNKCADSALHKEVVDITAEK